MTNIKRLVNYSAVEIVSVILQNCGYLGFPGASDGKESTCNVGDLGLILGLGRSPGGGHGNRLLLAWRIPRDRGAWRAGYSPWGHKESDMTE